MPLKHFPLGEEVRATSLAQHRSQWVVINMDPLEALMFINPLTQLTQREGGVGSPKPNNTTRAVRNYGENRLPAPVNIIQLLCGARDWKSINFS